MSFTPEVTHAAFAKVIVGTMVGFAVIAVLSLLWMRRVHKRGRFGPRRSATLRSLYPIVLGLAGWFLRALIVLTTMPSVPLDQPLLAVLSVGVPIGLGLYSAWVHCDWSHRTKTTGFAVAAGGALAGAWLGFNRSLAILDRLVKDGRLVRTGKRRGTKYQRPAKH